MSSPGFLISCYLSIEINTFAYLCFGSVQEQEGLIDRYPKWNPQIFLGGSKARKTYETDHQNKHSCDNCQENPNWSPLSIYLDI